MISSLSKSIIALLPFYRLQISGLSAAMLLVTTAVTAADNPQASLPAMIETLQQCEESVLDGAEFTTAQSWVALLQANCIQERETVLTALSAHLSPEEQVKTRADLEQAIKQYVQTKWQLAQMQRTHEASQETALKQSQQEALNAAAPEGAL